MPASSAIQPASRPMTSTTMMRWCDSAVVWILSTASVAVCRAVSKPKVISVAERSLSMVLGTPTSFMPFVVQEGALHGGADDRVEPGGIASPGANTDAVDVRHGEST